MTGMSTLLYYLIAILLWGVTIFVVPGDGFSDSGLFGATIYVHLLIASGIATAAAWIIGRRFSLQDPTSGSDMTAIGFVFLAAAAFYAVLMADFYLIGAEGDLRPHLYTPVWCGILAILFCLRQKWNMLSVLFFVLVVSFAHFYAISAAAFVYEELSPILADMAIGGLVTLDGEYLIPGFVGGALGSALSLFGLSLIRRGLRRPILIVGACMVLGLLGAVGLSLPEETPPAPAFWLYLPWQLVFGWVVVMAVGRRI